MLTRPTATQTFPCRSRLPAGNKPSVESGLGRR